jgi:release factor glutamine methyltransferase
MVGATPPTIADLLSKSAAWLRDKGCTSPRLDAELLLAEVLGMSRVDLYVKFDQPLIPSEIDNYREFIRRRAEGEPVAYILGRAYFHNLEIKVNGSVLIPRPETEHLVEAAIEFLMEGDWPSPPEVLDLCTGSGAIAIAIVKGFPEADITASDASGEALTLAAENATLTGVTPRIRFIQSDLFEDIDPVATYDLIVANPPYISAEEWEALPRDVREFEPREALYGGTDGLDFYRLLAEQAPQQLKPYGGLVLETGSTQAAAVSEMLEATGHFKTVGVFQDYAGLDRVVVAQRR